MKHFKWLVVALVIVVVGTFAAFTWFSLYLGREGLTIISKSSMTATPENTGKTYRDTVYGYTFNYPQSYLLEEPTETPYKKSVVLNYHNGSEGVNTGGTVHVRQGLLHEVTTEIAKRPGISRAGVETTGNISWQIFLYDPAKDTGATDQDSSTIYVTSNNDFVYVVHIDKSATKNLTESQIQKNSEALIRSWKFM